MIIATRTMPMPEELVDLFRCEVPGVAPLLFTGGPDRERPVRHMDRSVDFAPSSTPAADGHRGRLRDHRAGAVT